MNNKTQTKCLIDNFNQQYEDLERIIIKNIYDYYINDQEELLLTYIKINMTYMKERNNNLLTYSRLYNLMSNISNYGIRLYSKKNKKETFVEKYLGASFDIINAEKLEKMYEKTSSKILLSI
jgi:hypothetical protein